jgi:hypothetical protein
MKLLRYLAALLCTLVLAPGLSAQTWTQATDWTAVGTVAASGTADSTLQGGWIDRLGTWQINSSNYALSSSLTSNLNFLYRPSSENKVDWRVKSCFAYGGSGQLNTVLRWNGVSATASGRASYNIGLFSGGWAFSATSGGTSTSITPTLTGGTPALAASTNYCLDTEVFQLNASTTTLRATVTNSGGTVLYTATFNDTTAALQNAAGTAGLTTYVTAATNGANPFFNRITTFSTAVSPATQYSVGGPASGPSGVASANFTLSTNGTTTTDTVVTPSDGGAGGTFSPSTVTLPANASAVSTGTFTYTPSSTGAKTLSFTNSGTLTNPSPVTYQSLKTVAVDSGSFRFSPANWIGDSATCPSAQPYRCGSIYRQTGSRGAYFTVSWTTGATPTAVLRLINPSTTVLISYFFNGNFAARVPASGDINLTGVLPNATNTLTVHIAGWTTPTNAWNAAQAASATIQVGGLLLDTGSTPLPQTLRPWAAILGDSITAGYLVESAASPGGDNFLKSYTYSVGQALLRAGYDYSVQAGAGDGWFWGGQMGPIYKVASGTYNAAASRWDKITSAVSMLDSVGHISGYGAIGQEPALIFSNLVTNEAFNSVSQADTEASIRGALAAYRGAAPRTPFIVLVPFQLTAGPNAYPAYVQYLKNAFSAYKTSAPSDALTKLVDYGADFSRITSNVNTFSYDGTHPNATGASILAPPVISDMLSTLAPVSGATVQCTGSRSCALVAGAILAGG